jgi:hypothetical protein
MTAAMHVRWLREAFRFRRAENAVELIRGRSKQAIIYYCGGNIRGEGSGECARNTWGSVYSYAAEVRGLFIWKSGE